MGAQHRPRQTEGSGYTFYWGCQSILPFLLLLQAWFFHTLIDTFLQKSAELGVNLSFVYCLGWWFHQRQAAEETKGTLSWHAPNSWEAMGASNVLQIMPH